MMAKLKEISNEKGKYLFQCPGCKSWHGIPTKKYKGNGPKWDFNDNLDRPTFSPSIKIIWQLSNGVKMCHSYIRDGKIQFQGDSTHELAGKTIELPEIDES